MPRSKKDSTVTNNPNTADTNQSNVSESTGNQNIVATKVSRKPKASTKEITTAIATTLIDTTTTAEVKSSKTSSKEKGKATATKPIPKAETPEPKPNTITRRELSQEVAKTVGRMMEITNQDAEAIVAEVIQSIIDELLEGNKIEIRGFGAFKSRSRRSRRGRNPKTGEPVDIPSKRIFFFKMGKDLKEILTEK